MNGVIRVHLDIRWVIRQLFVSIGLEAFVRKVTSASSCMFMICLKCQNASSILNLTLVQTKNVHFFT